MILFSVGDHVWALRSSDHDLERGTVIAVHGDYTYTIRPDAVCQP